MSGVCERVGVCVGTAAGVGFVEVPVGQWRADVAAGQDAGTWMKERRGSVGGIKERW